MNTSVMAQDSNKNLIILSNAVQLTLEVINDIDSDFIETGVDSDARRLLVENIGASNQASILNKAGVM